MIIFLIIFIIIIVLTLLIIGIYFWTRPSATGTTGVPPNSPAFPNLQQGSKLVPPTTADAMIGSSVAISEDGNTMVIGCANDQNGIGCAYVYGRSGGVWTLQSGKLIGTGAVGAARQGQAVGVNSSATRIIVAAPNDDSNKGCVWIFEPVNGAWTQFGDKITADDITATANFGSSVDLADKADYFIVGSASNASNEGCAHIFTLEDNVWTQQGSALVGTGAVGAARQGFSVEIGDLAEACILGGPVDNANTGACWVFTRSDDIWTQLGSKITGTGLVGAASFGYSVAISGTDGNTIAVGSPNDNGQIGCVCIFSYEGGVVTQVGSKLIPVGVSGQILYGFAVELSNSGSTLVVGCPNFNNNEGCVFSLIRNNLLIWQQVAQLRGSGNSGPAQLGYAVSLSDDGTTCCTSGRSDSSGRGAVWAFIYSF